MRKYRLKHDHAINHSGRNPDSLFSSGSDPLPDLNYDLTIPKGTLEELRVRRRPTKKQGPSHRDLVNLILGLGLLILLCKGVILGSISNLPLEEKSVPAAPAATPAPALPNPEHAPTRLAAVPVVVRRADPVLFRQMHSDGTWALAYSTCEPARAEVLAKYSLKALPVR
jgi:hypothetical protein